MIIIIYITYSKSSKVISKKNKISKTARKAKVMDEMVIMIIIYSSFFQKKKEKEKSTILTYLSYNRFGYFQILHLDKDLRMRILRRGQYTRSINDERNQTKETQNSHHKTRDKSTIP